MYAYWGTPYKPGANDLLHDGGLDGPGLVTRAARDAGLDLGDPNHTAADDLRAYADPVATPRRGDLILFSDTSGTGRPGVASHVGVYIKPGVMIDAHDTGEGVGETNPESWYWVARQMGYWRPRGLEEG